MLGLVWAVVGFALVFFFPGYALTFLIFRKQPPMERVLFGFGISFLLAAAVAFLLGTAPLRFILGGWTQGLLIGAFLTIVFSSFLVSRGWTVRK